MKAAFLSFGLRQNFPDRNHSFGRHLTIWRRATGWESLTGATTVMFSSICHPRKTAMEPSEHCPKRSSPFLSKEVHPKAMRLENTLSANWFGSSSATRTGEIRDLYL